MSGANGTGKTTLCSVLSDRLQWKHVRIGHEFRRISKELKLEIKDFGSIPDELLREVDLIIDQKMASEEQVVYDGRLSCFLARNRANIFKIVCKADLEIRVKRTATRDNLTIAKARKKILDREMEEKTVFKRLYDLDNPFDHQWIDLVVDASNKTPEELGSDIITEMGF